MFTNLFITPLSNFLDFLYLFLGNYCFSIIVLTAIIRLVLAYPNFKAYQSQVKMKNNTNAKEIREKLALLQEKLKNSKNKEEQMEINMQMAKITRENLASMKSGCLNAFIQFPILLGLFYAIRGNDHIINETFLWFNLGTTDFWLILIAATITLIQLVISMRLNNSSQQQGQWLMYLIAPIMIAISASVMPSAIPLYWTVSALIATAQLFVFKLITN